MHYKQCLLSALALAFTLNTSATKASGLITRRADFSDRRPITDDERAQREKDNESSVEHIPRRQVNTTDKRDLNESERPAPDAIRTTQPDKSGRSDAPNGDELVKAGRSSDDTPTMTGWQDDTSETAPTPSSRPPPAATPPLRLRLAAGAGQLSGDSTFQIGGKSVYADGSVEHIHFPLSELEFPLDVTMGTIMAAADIGKNLTLRAQLSKNLTSDPGKTKDSDWGIWHLSGVPGFGPQSLDIYSESDTDLDALMLDANVSYVVLREGNLLVSIAVGYLYQQFDFELSNVRQEYPSTSFLFSPDYVPGKVSQYEVTYSIPYIQGILQFHISELATLEAGLGYSPIARAEDDGNWLLRARTFQSRTDGDALLAHLTLSVDLKSGWFLAVSVERTRIETDGTTKQYDFGDLLGELDKTIESDQTQYSLLVGRVF